MGPEAEGKKLRKRWGNLRLTRENGGRGAVPAEGEEGLLGQKSHTEVEVKDVK